MTRPIVAGLLGQDHPARQQQLGGVADAHQPGQQPREAVLGRQAQPWREVVSLAPAAAKRMSQKQASTRPTPAAGPLIAAITGLARPKWKAKSWSNSGRTP